MYYLTKFGGLKFSLFNASTEWGQVVRGETTMPLPGYGEFDIYGAQPAPIAPRLLPWSGVIKSGASRAGMAKQLRIDLERWVGMIGQSAQLQRQGMGITSYDYCTARLESIQYPTEGDIRKGHAPLSMLFQLQSPWLRGGLTLPFTNLQATANITNVGNRVAKPILRATVTEEAEYITFYHEGQSGYTPATRIAHLRFAVPSVATGNHVLEIDTRALRVTLDGQNAYQYFSFGEWHKRPEWMPLYPNSANRIRCLVYPLSSWVSWSVTYDIPMY